MGNNYTNRINGAYGYEGGINPLYARMVQKTFVIGRVGVANCNFNFAAAADHVQQNLNLGAIILANCVITQIALRCTETVVGVGDVQFSCGNVSSGTQFFPLTSCAILNTIVQLAAIPDLIWSNVNSVFLGGDPTDNTWNLMVAGQWELTIIYNDFSKL
jgi:hypothetical protein